MTFVKNWKSHFLFFEQNGFEKMFDDDLVRNKPSQTKKILILHSGNVGIFSKGSTDDFGQKLEIYPFRYFEQNRPRNIVCSSSSKKTRFPRQ